MACNRMTPGERSKRTDREHNRKPHSTCILPCSLWVWSTLHLLGKMFRSFQLGTITHVHASQHFPHPCVVPCTPAPAFMTEVATAEMSPAGDRTGAGFVFAVTSVRATMKLTQRGYKSQFEGWRSRSPSPSSAPRQVHRTGPRGEQDALRAPHTHRASAADSPRCTAW